MGGGLTTAKQGERWGGEIGAKNAPRSEHLGGDFVHVYVRFWAAETPTLKSRDRRSLQSVTPQVIFFRAEATQHTAAAARRPGRVRCHRAGPGPLVAESGAPGPSPTLRVSEAPLAPRPLGSPTPRGPARPSRVPAPLAARNLRLVTRAYYYVLRLSDVHKHIVPSRARVTFGIG